MPVPVHQVIFVLQFLSFLCLGVMYLHCMLVAWRLRNWWWSRSVTCNLHSINAVSIVSLALATGNSAFAIAIWLLDLSIHPAVGWINLAMSVLALLATVAWWSIEFEMLGPPD